MISKREQLARLLDLTPLPSLILRTRRLLGLPILSVLAYHRIARVGSGHLYDSQVANTTPEELEDQLDIVRRHFSVICIDDLLAAKEQGRPLPANPLLITFDDGYRSDHDVVVPILKRRDLTAVFFVAPHYLSHRRVFWWDRINYTIKRSARSLLELSYPQVMRFELPAGKTSAIDTLLSVVKEESELDLERFLEELSVAAGVAWSPEIERSIADELIMTWDDVRRIQAAGMDVQSHTSSHRVLQTLGSRALGEELSGSRRDLEQELDRPVTAVSYPTGRRIARDSRIRKAVDAAGYRLGFAMGGRVNYNWRSLDPLDVDRLCIDCHGSQALFRCQLAIPPLAYSISAND